MSALSSMRSLVRPRSASRPPVRGTNPAPDPSLVAERDRLVTRFTVLQCELDGLFYEMAIRDHVNMDVLLPKAALLQRVDSELAQVEHLLKEGAGAVGGHCPGCGVAHARGAGFCSHCGQRLNSTKGWLSWARETRATRHQLWLTIGVSASVGLVILVSIGAPTGWDAAALGALRSRDALTGGGGAATTDAQTGASGTLPSAPSSFPSLPTAPAGSSPAAPGASTGSGGSGAASPATQATGSGSGGSKSSSKTKSGARSTGSKKAKSSPIKHVFVIALATDNYGDAFGPASPASYLNGKLRPQGRTAEWLPDALGRPPG